MDSNDEDSISDVLLVVDNTIQYGEDLEVRKIYHLFLISKLEVKDRYPGEVDEQDQADLEF